MHKRGNFVTSGIISLFLIFAVLCMVVLSLLSYVTSQRDLQMSERSLQQNVRYYDSCTQATQIYQDLSVSLINHTDSEKAFWDACKTIASQKEGLEFDELQKLFILNLDFTDTQCLHLEFAPVWPVSEDESPIRILTWQTQTTGTWNPDQRQQVYTKKEDSNG